MIAPATTSESQRGSDAPRATILGLAWLVAIVALSNSLALNFLRNAIPPALPPAEVAKRGAVILAVANSFALAAVLYVRGVPRLLRVHRGWTRAAAVRILTWLAIIVFLKSLPAVVFEGETIRATLIVIGVGLALLLPVWGIALAILSIRKQRQRKV